MIRFIGACGIVVALVIGVSSALQLNKPSFFVETLILIVVTTLGIYRFLTRSQNSLPLTFTQLYLLTIVIKLLACLAYCVFMTLHDKEGAATNLLFFLLMYVVFTALEVGFLFNKISNPKKKG
jgi:O-antigen ligase